MNSHNPLPPAQPARRAPCGRAFCAATLALALALPFGPALAEAPPAPAAPPRTLSPVAFAHPQATHDLHLDGHRVAYALRRERGLTSRQLREHSSISTCTSSVSR